MIPPPLGGLPDDATPNVTLPDASGGSDASGGEGGSGAPAPDAGSGAPEAIGSPSGSDADGPTGSPAGSPPGGPQAVDRTDPNSTGPGGVSSGGGQPATVPMVHGEPLPAVAVLGGVGALFCCAGGAGALTFKGARAQQARIAAARAEFFAPAPTGKV
ncbi:MAG: hypothetical protein WAW17_14145 [Rhodococcus sp. (in: high G+C Gram-positive bacteria)]|uniref:hypothetical protein n=1 Tax=Rhodococcus sp. TaxID=1831 RepID=UPI003BAF952D